MKRYLVMCITDNQWEDYVETHRFCTEESLTLTMEEKENSFILKDSIGYTEAVYVKCTPKCEVPQFYARIAEKIWLSGKGWFSEC
jgi:hypothetical protein